MADERTPGDHGRPARHRHGPRRRCAPAGATCTPACTAAACSTRCTCCTRCSRQVLPGPDGRGAGGAARGHRAAVAGGDRVLEAAEAGRRRDRRGGRPAGAPGRGRTTTTTATAPTPRSTSTSSWRGEPRTLVPADGAGHDHLRLAPGQRPGGDPRGAGAAAALGRARGRRGGHSRANVAGPGAVGRSRPAMRLAAEALERACGMATALVRSGGSIPAVAELPVKGSPRSSAASRSPRTPSTRRTSPTAWRASALANAPRASCTSRSPRSSGLAVGWENPYIRRACV